jgi:acyl-CoA synthetase (NDP forming)
MAPRSIALVGASARAEAYGNGMIHSCLSAGFDGDVFLVNPRYDEIEGLACYPTVGDIPQPVDLAVLCVANERLEATLGDAIASGTGAAAIFASCYMDETGGGPVLTERLAAMARDAAMPICGGNSMGFYNTASRTHVSIGNRDVWPDGDVAMISQSGSVAIAMTAIAGRVNWNMLVSSGQELTVTAADYLDYALEMPSTRAVGAFLETVRDPGGFTAALEKASARDIPVVVVKVGRTEVSAQFAATHSGAIAGSDAAYEAVFDRYGVLRVDDMDELIATWPISPTASACPWPKFPRPPRRAWPSAWNTVSSRAIRWMPGARATITKASSATASRPWSRIRTPPSPCGSPISMTAPASTRSIATPPSTSPGAPTNPSPWRLWPAIRRTGA